MGLIHMLITINNSLGNSNLVQTDREQNTTHDKTSQSSLMGTHRHYTIHTLYTHTILYTHYIHTHTIHTLYTHTHNTHTIYTHTQYTHTCTVHTLYNIHYS